MSTTFLKHFDSITDPRIERCKKRNLLDILLAISAVLSGAEGWGFRTFKTSLASSISPF